MADNPSMPAPANDGHAPTQAPSHAREIISTVALTLLALGFLYAGFYGTAIGGPGGITLAVVGLLGALATAKALTR